ASRWTAMRRGTRTARSRCPDPVRPAPGNPEPPTHPPLSRRPDMGIISIIGTGSMAAAIGKRVARAGHTVEVLSRDPAKAQAFADGLEAGATTGTYGAAPAGEIVILAVPYANAAAVVAGYGDALDGKVIIDIANPVAPDLS